MNSGLKFCLVCNNPLPEPSRGNRKYCNATCSSKARQRKRRNKEIADPIAKPADITQLQLQLRNERKRTAQLQKTNANLRASNAQHQAQLQSVRTELQSLQDASATHIAKAYQLAQEENAQLQNSNAQLAQENAQLRANGNATAQVQEDALGAERYARTLRASYNKLYERWFAQAQRLNTVARDLLFYASYYYRATDQSGWNAEDYERHQRYSKLKAHPPKRPTRNQPRNNA